MRGVRKAAGSRFPVDSSDESTWESGGATTPVDHPDRGQGSPGIPDVVPGKGGTADMPRGGVPGKMATRTAVQVHFVHRHVLDTVVMLEEGNFPHPRCAKCNMQDAGPPEGSEQASHVDRAVC